MKIIHLVQPRTGPDNQGPTNCIRCNTLVFGDDGDVVYSTNLFDHTTDEPTWENAEEIEMEKCS